MMEFRISSFYIDNLYVHYTFRMTFILRLIICGGIHICLENTLTHKDMIRLPPAYNKVAINLILF